MKPPVTVTSASPSPAESIARFPVLTVTLSNAPDSPVTVLTTDVKPAPSIKIATNTATYQHMIDDMDMNAGKVLEGVTLDQVAAELMEMTLNVASGQPSKSEAQNVGESEFDPWHLSETL